MDILMFYVTFPDEQEALSISNFLLENKKIACFNLFPMKSGYWWEGELDQAMEMVAVYKTMIKLEKEVEAYILQRHSYDIPCIIRSIVQANHAYAKWVEKSVI